MNKIKIFVFIVLWGASLQYCFPQENPPKFITEEDISVSGDYIYFPGMATIVNKNITNYSAENFAILDAFKRAAKFFNVTVSDTVEMCIRNNGISGFDCLTLKTGKTELKSRFIADRYIGTEYSYILIGFPLKDKNVRVPPFPLHPGYGITPTLISVFFPGCGQIYKKQNGKGWSILISEVALASGYVVLNNVSNNYYNKAKQTSNIINRRNFLSASDTWETRRNIVGIGALLFYGYNLIDVIFKPGEKRYADVIPKKYEFFTNINRNDFKIGLCINLK